MAETRPAEEANPPETEVIKVARNAHTVLNIPELLELVLYHVADWPFFKNRNLRSIEQTDGFIDLYHCGLVCKFWKGIIDGSPTISRRLFRYNEKQPRTPIHYHQSQLGARVPTFAREGDIYPTICYPFVAWLARRVPRCFREGSKYRVPDLHDQYIKDKFPPSYFSNPPTTEVFIHFIELQFRIAPELWQSTPNISLVSVHWSDGHPGQSFVIRNEQGVMVEDIIQALCTLMHYNEEHQHFQSSPKSNEFGRLRVGIFRRTEQQGKRKTHRWISLTRHGAFSTREDATKPQRYEICNTFKLYSQNNGIT
ncbi:hypothetical protein TWF281_004788 [Arthrobotrys megalospora]